LAADDEEAQPSGRDFDDTASEASSAVSGMSAYQGSTTTGTSSVTGSSVRPASTVGGKRPHKRKQRKVFGTVAPVWLSVQDIADLTSECASQLLQVHNGMHLKSLFSAINSFRDSSANVQECHMTCECYAKRFHDDRTKAGASGRAVLRRSEP